MWNTSFWLDSFIIYCTTLCQHWLIMFSCCLHLSSWLVSVAISWHCYWKPLSAVFLSEFHGVFSFLNWESQEISQKMLEVKEVDRSYYVIAYLNVADIILNEHPHLISYLAQQVTSPCSRGTRAHLPTEYLLFWLLQSEHKRLKTGGERISNPTISMNRPTPPLRTHACTRQGAAHLSHSFAASEWAQINSVTIKGPW